MLTYLKPGDIYQKNDLLDKGARLVPLVIGSDQRLASLDEFKLGSLVLECHMVMKPRRWTPDNE